MQCQQRLGRSHDCRQSLMGQAGPCCCCCCCLSEGACLHVWWQRELHPNRHPLPPPASNTCICSFTHSVLCMCGRSFDFGSCIHVFPHSFLWLLIHLINIPSFVWLVIPFFSCSSMHMFLLSFTHSFTHSFVHLACVSLPICSTLVFVPRFEYIQSGTDT